MSAQWRCSPLLSQATTEVKFTLPEGVLMATRLCFSAPCCTAGTSSAYAWSAGLWCLRSAHTLRGRAGHQQAALCFLCSSAGPQLLELHNNADLGLVGVPLCTWQVTQK